MIFDALTWAGLISAIMSGIAVLIMHAQRVD
jgi:hypothetical protein